MLKNALETEKQLEQLRKEIVDMKKLKVKLMNQLRDETHKSKMEEQRRQREIAALKRDHLRKDNQIRSLEAEKRCREIVLKRKQEQIQALRKHNNGRAPMSEKVSGRAASASASHHEAHDAPVTSRSRVANGPRTSYAHANETAANSYVNKRKAAYLQKWQKFDETVSFFVFFTHHVLCFYIEINLEKQI